MQEEVLISAHSSAPRRVLGVSVIGVLGFLLMYLAIMRPPSDFRLQVFLIVVGFCALWLAVRMWRASQAQLELTQTVLRTSDGRVIAAMDNIASLDRSTFAFKPSNGFLLRLNKKGSKVWEPGVWWRLGRRVGVGGITSAPQTKAMSEIISAIIAERETKS